MGSSKVTGTNSKGREIRRPGKYCTTDSNTDEGRKRKRSVKYPDEIPLKQRATQMLKAAARRTASTATSSSIHRSVSSQKMIDTGSDLIRQKYSHAPSNSVRSTSVPPTRKAPRSLEFEKRFERPVSERPKDGATYEPHTSYASNNAGNVSNDPEDQGSLSRRNPLPSTRQNITINSKSNRSFLMTYSTLPQNNFLGREEREAHNVSMNENTKASNPSCIDMPDLPTDLNAYPIVVIDQDGIRHLSSGLTSQSTAVIDETQEHSTEIGVAQFPLQELTQQRNQKDNLESRNPTIVSRSYNGKENLPSARVLRMPAVMDQVTMTEFNQFKNEVLRVLEAQNRALIEKMDDLERTVRQSIVRDENDEDRYNVPNGIPFNTLDDFVNFENGVGLAKQELKSYLRFVGGVSHKEAVNQFLKETVSDALISEFTWIGGVDKQKLKGTAFAKTLHGALSCCSNLRKLSAAEFGQAMQHGLHVAKQRARDRYRMRHLNNDASGDEEYSEDESYSEDQRGDSVAENIEDSDE